MELTATKWTNEDSALARADGWDVFHVHGEYYDVQKFDEADQFAEDVVAIAHVFRMASSGSWLHRKAIAFVLRPGNVCPPPAYSLKAPKE